MRLTVEGKALMRLSIALKALMRLTPAWRALMRLSVARKVKEGSDETEYSIEGSG